MLWGTGFRSWGQGTSEPETGATASECHERLDDGLRKRKDSLKIEGGSTRRVLSKRAGGLLT